MSTTGVTSEHTEWFGQEFDRIAHNIGQFIQGKDVVIRMALVCLTAGGHLLIDDVPGVGKTSLAKAIGQSIRGTVKRIQFTPDLLPSDVTGVTVYSKDTETFVFKEGPVFANIVLADEINRASPKTQSALLEVMEERQITADGIRHEPPQPFLVIGTQNPVEQDGTYPLPEAQIDRFLMRMAIHYPAPNYEVDLLRLRTGGFEVTQLQPVSTIENVRHMIAVARQVRVPTSVHETIVKIANVTRTHPGIRLGVSPRGALALAQASQAWAAAGARTVVTMDDVKAVAKPVLAHRLILTADTELQGISQDQLVEEIVNSVPMPLDPSRV